MWSSFSSLHTDNKLSGWIAFTNYEGVCSFWNLEDTGSLVGHIQTGSGPLVKSPPLSYSICSWMEPGKNFLAIELEHTPKRGTVVGHIVVLDVQGNVIERIVNNKLGTIAGSSFPSTKNKRIVYTYKIYKEIVSPNEKRSEKEILSDVWKEPSSLVVIDYKTRKEEIHINDFSKGGSLYLREFPWSPDEKKFVYTILKNIQVSLKGQPLNSEDDSISTAGSYIFDVEKAKDVKFIPGSVYAVFHPVSNKVAYIKNNEVWIYDLDADSSHILYSSKHKTDIMDIRWSPKGDYIYVRHHVDKSRKSKQLLIKADGGKVMPNITFPVYIHHYTWR